MKMIYYDLLYGNLLQNLLFIVEITKIFVRKLRIIFLNYFNFANMKLKVYIYIYKVCLSDHNSGTPGPICRKC